jgi:hypothetical protein
VLRGESPPRIAFLRKLIDEGGRIEPTPGAPFGAGSPVARQGQAHLIYFGLHQPAEFTSELLGRLVKGEPALEKARWSLEVIDPWEMTVTPIPGEHVGRFRFRLPGRPYLALRATPAPVSSGDVPAPPRP